MICCPSASGAFRPITETRPALATCAPVDTTGYNKESRLTRWQSYGCWSIMSVVRSSCRLSVAGEHLKGREIGERDAHRFGHINAIGDRHQETRGADRVLSVAANHAEIRDQFTLAPRTYTGDRLIDDTHEFVSWRERQRSLEVGV